MIYDRQRNPIIGIGGGKYKITDIDSTGAATSDVLTFDGTEVTWAAGGSGTPGATGPTGPAGAAGATGATGPAGANGATGAAGAEGPTGPAGSAGATGPIGATGPTGPMNYVVSSTFNFGPTGITSITIVNGVITAIS